MTRRTIDKIIRELQDKKQLLIDKLLEHVNIERDANTKELFSKLKNGFKVIEDFSLNSQDLFENISKVKTFNEEMLPGAKSHIVEITKVVATWKLDGSKLDLYEKELNYFIENLQFHDFLCDSRFRSLMHLDIPDSLKTAHQSLGLISKLDILDEEVIKLRQDNESLKEKLEGSVQAHNQAKLDNTKIQNQVNSLTQENTTLKDQNTRLNTQINTLQSAKTRLETEVNAFSSLKTCCGIKPSFNRELIYCKGTQNGCTANGTVWGSGPYTSDSDSCKAARHSGIIGPTGGFFIRETVQQTLNSFSGTTQNGVTSSSYGSYQFSRFYAM